MFLGHPGGIPGGFGESIGGCAGSARDPVVCGGGGGGWERRRSGVRRPDGDDARAEFNADGDVVMGREAPLAEADGERGLAAS